MKATNLRQALDWGRLGPLRLRAREVAEGLYSGPHRSVRRGSGVEFGGHRNYVAGDDLRFIDRRAVMRHDRLLVREFETETDRGIRFLIDATRSMAYRSDGAPGAKLAFASLIAAALARVALSGHDAVSLDWIGGADARPLASTGGTDAFDRLVTALEPATASGDVHDDLASVDRSVARVTRRTRRGTVVVVLSDFLDLPDGSLSRIASLASGGRALVGVRVLDPAEVSFPFDGPVRLRASEGDFEIETDAGAARTAYLARFREATSALEAEFARHGARFVDATTTDDPVATVGNVLSALERSAP